MTPRMQRFASVDALRGLAVAAMLLVNNPGDWGHVYAPLQHAQWHGFTVADLVFPLFLFVVGVSVALGIVPRLEGGAEPARIRRAVWLRGAKIVGLGLLLHLLAYFCFDQDAFRPWGVLQRIGLCFIAVGLLATVTASRAQWALIVALLLGYWALLAWGGSYEPWTNLASRIDAALLGRHAYQFDAASGRGHDPEGLLGTLPAIATTLVGLRAGAWLRRGDLRALALAGAGALLLGGGWSLVLPLNKNLWTPSFVLWSAGWSILLLAVGHALIDRRHWPALGRRFGANAIAAYAGAWILLCLLSVAGWWEPLYRHGFAGWMTPYAGPYLPSLAFALAYVLLWWGVVAWMDRRGWHLKL